MTDEERRVWEWLEGDPLREADADRPDIGAVPFGATVRGVGVNGRIPPPGGPPGKWPTAADASAFVPEGFTRRGRPAC
jgi:hypothetical protein